MAEAKKKTESLVTIENKRKRMLVYNLAGEHMRGRPHREFGYQRITQYQTVTNPRTGAAGQKKGRASVPSSITFCSREKKVNLPHALLLCPEIKTAMSPGVGDLKVTYQDGPIKVEEKAKPRKTGRQLQDEAKAAAKKIEDDHAKSLAETDKKSAKPTRRNAPPARSAVSSD